MLLAFGAKQLRAACYCRQLRIVKSGAECNDSKLGYVALLMKLKRAYAKMQQLQVEDVNHPDSIYNAERIHVEV
ncbi:uncharacterized protein PITG_06844 [Phytophthora infestans T30-4]|uniref:Uncharacterized protein n=1 Tax=Phytophthora infestans (strain T30-4) TaxID=403677 RepID=D0N6L0_PHYIT|nr:uncharacterized protein PITG_06844 [Phytophthora infestans T30-4]EEY53209.1 hypothetical protein PITG_06844 [Phytophthora infestans T30-4]|eukprot:XP_002904827.1 hypothetical protein PITG_06844 [Phytophthora infestans T30-4]